MQYLVGAWRPTVGERVGAARDESAYGCALMEEQFPSLGGPEPQRTAEGGSDQQS
jgi:hypothetical protein